MAVSLSSRFCTARGTLVSPVSCMLQQVATKFFEPDKKGGYDTKIKMPIKDHLKRGMKEIKPEIIKWKDEWMRNLRCDKVSEFTAMHHNDYEIVWKFDEEKETDSWLITTDKDHGEGKSTAQFVHGPNKTGLFRGMLNTDVPKDGIVKESGYANIRSPTNMISFRRTRPYDWSPYTHLLVKTRGDGRPYQIVIGMDRYYDVNWNDQYAYPLYTRGGPYWQISKIPFNKFYLSGKGRIQDKQEHLQLNSIAYVGITLADGYTGPYQLELDWIGLVYDESHNDKFAYEMYEQGYLLSD